MKIYLLILFAFVSAGLAHAGLPGSVQAVAVGRPDEPIAVAVFSPLFQSHVLLIDERGRRIGELRREGRVLGLRLVRGALWLTTTLGLERIPLASVPVAASPIAESAWLGRAGALAVSPDGRWSAYTESRAADLVRQVPALRIESAGGAETQVRHGLMPARHRPGDFVKGFHHIISNIDEPCGPGPLTHSIDAATFSPDGKRLAVALERRVRIFSVPDGARVGSARTGTARAPVLAFSPDGRRLAVAAGREVLLLDGTRGTPVDRLELTGEATSLAFSPDGSQLAVGLRDRVEIRDLVRRERVRVLRADGIFCVAFSGPRLAAGGTGGLHLWSLPEGRELLRLPAAD